jgi:hypothetical protein
MYNRFGPGEGLELDQSRCMKGSAYSVIIEVSEKSTAHNCNVVRRSMNCALSLLFCRQSWIRLLDGDDCCFLMVGVTAAYM